MTFLAMIIALVLDRFSPVEDWLHRDHWFYRWQSALVSTGIPGTLQLLFAVLLPCIAAYLVLEQLELLLFGLVWIVAAALVLLYAMGRGNLSAEQEHYRSQCRRGDFEGALLAASSRYRWFSEDCELDRDLIHQRMQQGFLYQGYQRWFAVLFYFLLLGPVGALAYRLLHMSAAQDQGEQGVLLWADWLPVRLLAVAFALTGNFIASADELWDVIRSPHMSSSEVLYKVAMAATGVAEEPEVDDGISGQRAAMQNEIFSALMWRSGVFWVALIALLVILL